MKGQKKKIKSDEITKSIKILWRNPQKLNMFVCTDTDFQWVHMYSYIRLNVLPTT